MSYQQLSAFLSKPFDHIHRHYPRGVYEKNFRNNQRFTTSIICLVDNNSDGKFEDFKTIGPIKDISLDGAMIESYKRIGKIKDDLECTFRLSINGIEMLFSIHNL
ncbi:MAG TPA: PilZ domain-containing protein, partial [Methylophilaceae bacterium]|nr:PilZ domain-containing protein [Methylophilaceae bacterium]